MKETDSKVCVRCDVEIPLDRTTNLCSKCYEDELEDWEYGHADHPDYEDENNDCPRCNGLGDILIHPSGIPFSQSLADLIECPDCNGTGEV